MHSAISSGSSSHCSRVSAGTSLRSSSHSRCPSSSCTPFSSVMPMPPTVSSTCSDRVRAVGPNWQQQLHSGLFGEHQVAVDRELPALLQRLPDALDAVGGKDFFGRFGNLLVGEHQLLREGKDGDAPLHRVKA